MGCWEVPGSAVYFRAWGFILPSFTFPYAWPLNLVSSFGNWGTEVEQNFKIYNSNFWTCAHHPGVSSANTISFCHITHNAQLVEQTCCYYDLSTSVEYIVYTAARALVGAQPWGQSKGSRCSPGPAGWDGTLQCSGTWSYALERSWFGPLLFHGPGQGTT